MKARFTSTLNAAMGPIRKVMGAPRRPSSGIVVLSIRFNPVGAFNQLLAKGLIPCTIAQGVWARNQISSCTSVPPEDWIEWAMP